MSTTKKPTAKELKERKDNYMIIFTGYGEKFVVPYIDGLKVLEGLENAELYDDTKWENHTIKPLGKDGIQFKVIAEQRYLNLKTAHLLGVSVDELESEDN